MATATFSLQLPVAADAFGRWLEEHGGSIEISCTIGQYAVAISWCRLHSYNDTDGEHRETWSVSRHGADIGTTLAAAFTEALRISQNKLTT